MRFLTGLFVIILMISGIMQSPIAEARETEKFQWDFDHKGKKYLDDFTLGNSICSLSFLETKETEKSEKIWLVVDTLPVAENGYPAGTWYILGNSNDKVIHASVICTRLDPKLHVVPATGDAVQCKAGWGNFSVAQCPKDYTLVSGGCDFTCEQGTHFSSLPMLTEGKYRCGAVSTDVEGTFTAHALCLKH